MKKENNAVLQGLLDSKKEYVEYLNDCFTDSIIDCFQRMYKDCLAKPEFKTGGKNILVLFQQQLTTVPSWNQSLISDEYNNVLSRSNCNYIPALIKACLIVYVKISLMTHYSSIDIGKIKLRIPSAETFYHRCLIICAGELWKQPYLLYHKVRSIEQQHNLNEIDTIVKKAIKNALRMFVPIDQLLNNLELPQQESDDASPDADVSDTEDTEDEESIHETSEDDETSESQEATDVFSRQESVDEASEEDEEEVPQREEDDDVEYEAPKKEEDTDDEHTASPDSENEEQIVQETVEQVYQDDNVLEEKEHDDTLKQVFVSTEESVLDTVHSPFNVAKVDEIEPIEADPVPLVANNKKIVLGSMLINKDRLKKAKLLKVKKHSDSFF